MSTVTYLYRGAVPAPVLTVAARYRSTAFALRLDARLLREQLRAIEEQVADRQLSRQNAMRAVALTMRTRRHYNERQALRLALLLLWLAVHEEGGAEILTQSERGGFTIGYRINGELGCTNFRLIAGPSTLHPFRDFTAIDRTLAQPAVVRQATPTTPRRGVR